MTTAQYIFSILSLALAAVQSLTGGSEAVGVAQALEQIIQQAVTAYQQHTGEAIDPARLRSIAPVE